MIKAIFLDFYGTVVYEDGENVSKISQMIYETGNAQSASQVGSYWWDKFKSLFENAYGENFETQRALETKSLIDTIRYFESSQDGIKLSEEMFEYWVKPPIFKESKQFFSECPVPIYIVSNIDRADILAAIEFHGLNPKDVFTSEDAKSYKPRKELFELALKETGLEADEVLHIGDSLSSDVKGANSVGIKAIWLNRSGKDVPENVTAVGNLLEVLPRLYAEKLVCMCGLGKTIADIEAVSGGFMHRMYKVITDSGIYAVKHLNAEIMKRPGVHENYARAEKIEEILENNSIPIVPAMVIGGTKMQKIDNRFFYVFRWQEGKISDWNHISKDMCFKAGNILGKIHAIEPKNIEYQAPLASHIDWRGYVLKAKEENSVIASLLEDNEALLVCIESELNQARESLPAMQCVSNEDMDPKNIMWDNGTPWMIDLECLDYGNPISHVLQLALQWSGIVSCKMDVDKMVAFFDGYLEAYDNCFRGYSDVAGVAYTWVEWLEYNTQRALGKCMDEAERELGISEVRNTMDRIKYIHKMLPQIKEALNTRLRKRDVTQYDNHDGRICYYSLLLERQITDMPKYSLPAGYRFVPYSDGDKAQWITIEMSAKEFTTYEQGVEAWNRYYADTLDILPDRMFFIENENGEKIATATAFYDIYGRDNSGAGWLHWVAIKREYQGKGLSKPLITYVLNVMKNLGYSHAKIPTQTNTWLACKVYLDLGFLPVKENLEHSYEGWKIVKELTGHSALKAM